MKQKVRILHVLKSNDYSGAENVVITICKTLNNKYEMAYTSVDGPIRTWLKKAGIPFYPMRNFTIAELRKVIQKFHPDIVHAHDFSASVYCALLKRNYHLLSHLHNNPSWIQTWNAKTLCYWLLKSRIECILLVSKAIQDEAVFLKQDQAFIINNPLDVNGIKKESEEFQTPRIDFLFVGRFMRQKNPQRFIRIIQKVHEHKPDVSAVMIGTGELEKTCREQIRQIQLENNIRMMGFCENPYPYIKNARVLLVTSDWEGYGLVAVEASILETPVLAMEVGGLKSIFQKVPEVFCHTEMEFCEKAVRLLDDTHNRMLQKKIAKNVFINGLEEYMGTLEKVYKGLSR